MSIILKYVFKNMWEKKGRTFLVTIAVVMSSAIFFSTQSLSDNLENLYLHILRKDFGTADISIQGTTTANQFFEMDNIDSIADKYLAVVGCFSASGYLQKDNEQLLMRVNGYSSVSDLDGINKVIIESGKAADEELENDEIVIGQTTAFKYNYKIGDMITVRIAGKDKDLEIVSIAYADGLFIETGGYIPAITSQDMLNECYGTKNRVNCIFIDISNTQDINEEIETIRREYPEQTITELFSETASRAYTDRITVSFYLMSIAVFFISIFLIYSSFKVISLERMPIFGIFRSIGATKITTNLCILLEAVMCAVIGGITGCVGGIGLLYAMIYLSAPDWMRNSDRLIEIRFSYNWMAISFAFSIIITIISVILPMLSSNRYSISMLMKIKKEDGKTARFHPIIFLIKVFLFAVVWIGIRQAPNSLILYYGAFSCVAIIILLMVLVYDAIKLLNAIWYPMITFFFRHEGAIAINNLNESVCTINNVRLLTISMTVFLMINIFGTSLITSISDFFSDCQYQIEISGDDIDQDYIVDIEELENVDTVYPEYHATNVKIKNSNQVIPLLNGVNSQKHLMFYNFNFDEGSKQEVLNELDHWDNIIISSTLQISLSLEKGDRITLEMDEGDVVFTIIGCYDTLESTALISEDSIKRKMNYENYSKLYVKAKDIDTAEILSLKEQITITSSDMDLQVNTVDEIRETSLNSNRQIIIIMQMFSLITLIIAVLGMANNIFISFMEKRRIYAVQRSIGMSKYQLIKISLTEAFLVGLIGSILGISGGLCLLYIAPKIMMSLGLRVVMNTTIYQIMLCLGCGILITILTSLYSSIETSRMAIIEAIKYE